MQTLDLKSTATRPNTNPKKSSSLKQKTLTHREAVIYLLLDYFIRTCKAKKLLFPKEIKLIIVDYSIFGYFHPEDHKFIKISNNGLTATNKAQNGYGTILFGFPFERSPKSIRMKNSKHFKQTYVVKFVIDEYATCQNNDSVAIAFVPLNYSLFNGAPDQVDGTYVIYGNGDKYGWISHRLPERNMMIPLQKKMIIKINLKDHTAKILFFTNVNSDVERIIDVTLPKNKNDIDDEHDIIRLAFVLNSPWAKNNFETQITVVDQYWE